MPSPIKQAPKPVTASSRVTARVPLTDDDDVTIGKGKMKESGPPEPKGKLDETANTNHV